MVFVKNGRAEGGTDVGMMSLADCQLQCLEETGCIGIDYNKGNSICYIHSINDKIENDDCCESYRKGCESKLYCTTCAYLWGVCIWYKSIQLIYIDIPDIHYAEMHVEYF